MVGELRLITLIKQPYTLPTGAVEDVILDNDLTCVTMLVKSIEHQGFAVHIIASVNVGPAKIARQIRVCSSIGICICRSDEIYCSQTDSVLVCVLRDAPDDCPLMNSGAGYAFSIYPVQFQ